MASKALGVAEAAARGAYAQALSVALEAWRKTPDATIADAIDALTARALERWVPPRGQSKAEFQKAWLTAAQSPSAVAVGWLTRTLGQRVPEVADSYGILRPDYVQTRYVAWFARLEALAKLGPDPRIAAQGTALLREAGLAAWDETAAEGVYGPLMALVAANHDRRQIPRLAELLENPRADRATTRAYFARALPPLIAQLEQAPSGLGAVERAEWAELGSSREARRPDGPAETDLIAAVYANPDDLDARAVYADWLSDNGDPRGEFISLGLSALRRPLTDAERRRSNRLLKEHQGAWLGVLAQVFRGLEFRAGFLDHAELAQNAAADPAIWAKAAEAPQLATLRTLAVGRGNAANYARILLSPHATGLRRVEVQSHEVLQRLLQGPPRAFRHIALHRLPPARQNGTAEWRRAFPELTTIDFEVRRAQDVRKLAGHPMLNGLRTLRLYSIGADDEVVVLRDAVGVLLPGTGLERLELRRHGSEARFFGVQGKLAARVVDTMGYFWDRLLNQLPPVAELELVLPLELPERSPDPEERVAELRKAGIDVTFRREPKPALEKLFWD